ncbi:DNA alkylation repair protein [Colwellia demingiae]|uniref:DNA alkylation repair protein n=1 Tax=Colwellia demingiae TaxID=89401 RepID=A0A5C6Q535_9GAMM|nr:DNA alkylation repair protein [Colwellia demingiae]TWX63932.1 DNA alkylation repair protein [Colwellia demingiae]
MEPFKNLYNEGFYLTLSIHLKACLPDFDEQEFMALMLCDNFEALELKERMSHTKAIMHQFMPTDFPQAAEILVKLIASLTKVGITEGSVEYMFLPEYIETYGIDHFQESVDVMEKVTQFTSGEFAVRPFLIKYGNKMLAQMILWSQHEHYSVRRLASEGSRPRLPWAIALQEYKKNPVELLPILHRLIDDPTEIVRRSAANNLNDIAKDNPQVVIDFVKEYLGKSEQFDRTLKHACRTLLKQACPEALALFGYDSTGIELTEFEILTNEVNFGEYAQFSFSLKNTSTISKKIRLEYGLYFMKKNGQLSKKVFKISERNLAANESHKVERKQSFKAISTRVLYPGKHQVSIILNGREFAPKDFVLIGAADSLPI